MFNNLRISIFVYYFVTVVAFIAFAYYFFVFLAVESFFILAVVALCFIILSGVFISKLAVDPLMEYVKSLQNLSKETLHELNLPVSTIMSNAQLLKRNLEDSKALKRLERIESACQMLQEHYNELDYMIKMQSREDVKELFCVDELVKERVDFLSKVYPHVIFNLSLEKLEINNDRKGLSKVIDNVIDNGVKYSGISKKIDIYIADGKLCIQDYGIGMDEVELLHIYDTYYQSNSNMQGFGIGLSMVKRFCDKNAIGLHFTSKLQEGTTVVFKFIKI